MDEIKASFPQAVAILSNSVGTNDDIDHIGALETEQNMDIPVIRHASKKPACLDEVLQHFRENMQYDVQPEQICVVGDRYLHIDNV